MLGRWLPHTLGRVKPMALASDVKTATFWVGSAPMRPTTACRQPARPRMKSGGVWPQGPKRQQRAADGELNG